jgi:hypothetical protein
MPQVDLNCVRRDSAASGPVIIASDVGLSRKVNGKSLSEGLRRLFGGRRRRRDPNSAARRLEIYPKWNIFIIGG